MVHALCINLDEQEKECDFIYYLTAFSLKTGHCELKHHFIIFFCTQHDLSWYLQIQLDMDTKVFFSISLSWVSGSGEVKYLTTPAKRSLKHISTY